MLFFIVSLFFATPWKCCMLRSQHLFKGYVLHKLPPFPLFCRYPLFSHSCIQCCFFFLPSSENNVFCDILCILAVFALIKIFPFFPFCPYVVSCFNQKAYALLNNCLKNVTAFRPTTTTTTSDFIVLILFYCGFFSYEFKEEKKSRKNWNKNKSLTTVRVCAGVKAEFKGFKGISIRHKM